VRIKHHAAISKFLIYILYKHKHTVSSRNCAKICKLPFRWILLYVLCHGSTLYYMLIHL